MTARLQNVILPVCDFNKAERFYRDVLGLELKYRDGENWIQLKIGDMNVALASPRETPSGATGATPVFEVDDLDHALAQLKALDTPLIQLRDMGNHGRTATVRDPAGNLVQLFQRFSQK